MSNGTTTWNYSYNSDGIRTRRTNGTMTYSYVYNGGTLTQMTVGTDTLYFAYGSSGPVAVTYNGTTYYYATNIQGDIIAIVDSTGAAVVTYTYDAWGNILTTSGTLASTLGTLNPLRYRGYVYDTETGLYYLQSRYYDPEIGRFINCDIVFDYDAGLQGYNLFLYCGNNPINRIDISGADSLQIDDKEEDLDEKSSDGCSPNGGSHPVFSEIDHNVASNNYAGTSGRTEVHHVVEQCQTTKSGFSNSQIQAASNKVELDYSLHRAISGFYSSKQDFTGGLRVRDWLASKSFAEQTAFGWKTINYFYTLLYK